MKPPVPDQRAPAEGARIVRHYRVQVAPRGLLGRMVAAAIALALVALAFVFFSIFVAVGLGLAGLVIVVALLKSALGGGAGPRVPPEPRGPHVIDTRRSPEDGVFRPRDPREG